ncbi:MAG TPA: phosphonate ABC transporter, permease protein PhnE, partial [Paracoccaceae bacterium]|nr:phosphonate ABC transporter, permease protein PhnE [Paracoccaceae bacterium]
LQRLRFAVWPQMLPAFLRGTADRFERYLRAALILGIVGAGGTGALVEASLREGAPERLATLVLVVVGLVILLELAGARLRRALG